MPAAFAFVCVLSFENCKEAVEELDQPTKHSTVDLATVFAAVGDSSESAVLKVQSLKMEKMRSNRLRKNAPIRAKNPCGSSSSG